MARGAGPLAFAQTVLLAGALLLLGIVALQLDGLERRVIAQSSSLAELTEVVRRGGPALAASTSDAQSAGASASARVWLHPDVANFLSPPEHPLRAPEARDGGRLVRWFGTDPKGFNPLLENAADVSEGVWAYVLASFAQRQVYGDPDRWQPELAERVELTDDGRTFTIYLRPGVRWHAPGNLDLGDPRYTWLRGDHFVSARDVAFSVRLLLDPQVENGFAKNYYEDLQGVEVVDDLTLVVRWKKTFCGAVEATLGLSIVPEFLYAHAEDGTRFPDETLGLRFNQHWYNNRGVVGAGPYRLVAYQPGTELRLERNEDWFGEKPPIRELVYAIYADPNATLLKLKAHELSVAGLRPSQYRDEIRRLENMPPAERPPSAFFDGRIAHHRFLDTGYFYLGWNADRPMFRDRRVRRALTQALNRRGIIENVFEGLGEVAVGPYPAQSPYHDPAIEPWPFDLDAARALLREAGFEDTDGDGVVDGDPTPDDGTPQRVPFELTLLIVNGSSELEATANLYREDLLRIGVRMRIESVEWSLMQKRMDEKEFDAYTGGWALGWEQDPFQLFHSSQAEVPKGSNRVGFRNAEADRLLEAVRRSCDPATRTDLLRRFHRILHEEQPYTFFYVRRGVFAWWKEVEGMVFAKTRPHTWSFPWWIDARP